MSLSRRIAGSALPLIPLRAIPRRRSTRRSPVWIALVLRPAVDGALAFSQNRRNRAVERLAQ